MNIIELIIEHYENFKIQPLGNNAFCINELMFLIEQNNISAIYKITMDPIKIIKMYHVNFNISDPNFFEDFEKFLLKNS